MRITKKIILGSAVLFFCVSLAGCATLGNAAGGMFNLTATLVKIPFDVLGKVLDFASKMPKPPPGVFF